MQVHNISNGPVKLRDGEVVLNLLPGINNLPETTTPLLLRKIEKSPFLKLLGPAAAVEEAPSEPESPVAELSAEEDKPKREGRRSKSKAKEETEQSVEESQPTEA